MFGLSWGQIIIIVLVGMFVLGPERIPVAVQWSVNSLKKVRNMAQGAQAQLQKEIGPELDELRRQVAELQSLKEVQELRNLRDLHPRKLIGKGLLGNEGGAPGIAGFLGFEPGLFDDPTKPKPDVNIPAVEESVAVAGVPVAAAPAPDSTTNGATTNGATTNGATTNSAATNGAATNGAAATALGPTARGPTAREPTAREPTAREPTARWGPSAHPSAASRCPRGTRPDRSRWGSGPRSTSTAPEPVIADPLARSCPMCPSDRAR